MHERAEQNGRRQVLYVDLETYRALVLLVAAGAMSAVVAVWIAWTGRRREDRHRERDELLHAIVDTERDHAAFYRWLLATATGADAAGLDRTFGRDVYPAQDARLIGDAVALGRHNEVAEEIMVRSARGHRFGADVIRLIAEAQNGVFAALSDQRDRVKGGLPLRQLSPEEEQELLSTERKLARMAELTSRGT